MDYKKIVQELEDFRRLLNLYWNARQGPEEAADKINLREQINERIPVIKYYIDEIGLTSDIRAGITKTGQTLYFNLLNDIFNFPVFIPEINIRKTIDLVTKSIGLYKYLTQNKMTILDFRVTPIIDIINLIKKNLRKAFKKEPENEIEVQDRIELILNVGKINFTREKESFSYSSKSYKPDFVIKDLEAVVEAKFCNSKEDEKKIIAEINDDILAYKTRYQILIFVVYDLGKIRDVDKFMENLTKISNVYLEVIKH